MTVVQHFIQQIICITFKKISNNYSNQTTVHNETDRRTFQDRRVNRKRTVWQVITEKFVWLTEFLSFEGCIYRRE